jgi:hypothetical protein
MKKSVCVIAVVVAGAAVVGCSGDRGPSVTASGRNAGLPPSPCRGIDPWHGAALRRCTALVSRWAPVESVRLTTQLPPRVRSTCVEARRQVRVPVVCPPLVPADGVVSDPYLYGAESRDSAGDFYLLTFNNGQIAGHTHWIVGAGRGQTVHRYLFDPRRWAVPGRVRRLDERRYGPWAITFYRFPPYPSGGELGGHDLALAHLGDTTYFASVHGRTRHDADAAMLLAMLLTAGVHRRESG